MAPPPTVLGMPSVLKPHPLHQAVSRQRAALAVPGTAVAKV